MSREIKFRAWDKENNKMHYDVQDISGMNTVADFASFERILNSPMENEYGWIDEFKRFQVMQHIGIEDKNKKEIYERDIVKIDGQQELFAVVWVCDTARFGLQSKTQLLYFEFGLGSKIEVIGNIYENSDLLKE